jgi:hypothetical protein
VPATTQLTLRAGFDLALDPVKGRHGSQRTRRYDQMMKYRDRLFGSARHVVVLIDPNLTWSDLVPSEARALWRKMADRRLARRKFVALGDAVNGESYADILARCRTAAHTRARRR